MSSHASQKAGLEGTQIRCSPGGVDLQQSSKRSWFMNKPCASMVSLANSAPEQEVRATGFFEAAFLCAVALLMITAIQMES